MDRHITVYKCETFKGKTTHACVHAVTYLCIDRLPYNLVLTHFLSFFNQNNLDIDLTYTTHNLNNLNKYPSITCSYI